MASLVELLKVKLGRSLKLPTALPALGFPLLSSAPKELHQFLPEGQRSWHYSCLSSHPSTSQRFPLNLNGFSYPLYLHVSPTEVPRPALRHLPLEDGLCLDWQNLQSIFSRVSPSWTSGSKLSNSVCQVFAERR